MSDEQFERDADERARQGQEMRNEGATDWDLDARPDTRDSDPDAVEGSPMFQGEDPPAGRENADRDTPHDPNFPRDTGGEPDAGDVRDRTELGDSRDRDDRDDRDMRDERGDMRDVRDLDDRDFDDTRRDDGAVSGRITDVPDDGQIHMVEDIDAYASTEPLAMEDQGEPVERRPQEGDRESLLGRSDDDVDHADADAAHDDRRASDDMLRSDNTRGADDMQHADEHSRTLDDSDEQEIAEAWTGGSESSIEDVRDGGYGVGSAAPIGQGTQPLGHPIKAWEDTMTFVRPGEPGYDEAEPHVWFDDDESAERAGFRRAHL